MKRIKLLKPSKDGGINMIDIESMFRAVKAAWIPRVNAADPTKQSWVSVGTFLYFKICKNRRYQRIFNRQKILNFQSLKTCIPFAKKLLWAIAIRMS